MPAADTIFAPATAPRRAAIAVVRLSGPAAAAVLAKLCGRVPPPRRASLVRIADAAGETIDDAIALFFPAPASLTGEDVVELQLHGGRAVTAAVLERLAAEPGLRPAEPGEFTRRAFLNGKLDLTEAEGLADLIDAETAAQRKQALRQMEGALGRLYEDWRKRLLRAQALIEAEIDFPEEGLPAGLLAATRAETRAIAREIRAHLADGRRGERLREGVAVAIVGPPNAGKSSLMNALARRDVAITAATAGTTRDVVEAALDLGGYPVLLADTAGLREAADAIEEEGVRRARVRAAAADLKLVLVDATRPEEAAAAAPLAARDAIVVANKIDLLARPEDAAWADRLGRGPASRVSVVTGEGMPALLQRLGDQIAARLAPGPAALITRTRHRAALETAVAALARSETAGLAELAAEELRTAVQAIGRITGRVAVEDLLDVIFREFCIGK
jgi:tRNA modification GTPase